MKKVRKALVGLEDDFVEQLMLLRDIADALGEDFVNRVMNWAPGDEPLDLD